MLGKEPRARRPGERVDPHLYLEGRVATTTAARVRSAMLPFRCGTCEEWCGVKAWFPRGGEATPGGDEGAEAVSSVCGQGECFFCSGEGG